MAITYWYNLYRISGMVGLPEALLKKYSEVSVVIPMWDERVRSLNLANAASIVLYEAIRQNLKDFSVPDALSVSER